MPKLVIIEPQQKEEMDYLYKVSYGGVEYDEHGITGFWCSDEQIFKTSDDALKHYNEVKDSGEWDHIQYDCLHIEKGENYDEDPYDYEEVDCEGIECFIKEIKYYA